MASKKAKRGREELREEALRPSPYLGYDRDNIAAYLLEIGALEIAEGQWRRAVWLNPFEPKFKGHLACCLCRRGRLAEAREWIRQALAQRPEDDECRRIMEEIERNADRERRDSPDASPAS